MKPSIIIKKKKLNKNRKKVSNAQIAAAAVRGTQDLLKSSDKKNNVGIEEYTEWE
ncbi:hypothetical protein [Aliikangiella sp. IMCC44359]|uniref:hypothetical protein n=1 Tax=Aliikangiella sp. IMCC44359 TaxID=3459125 RepID=UPI00403A9C52